MQWRQIYTVVRMRKMNVTFSSIEYSWCTTPVKNDYTWSLRLAGMWGVLGALFLCGYTPKVLFLNLHEGILKYWGFPIFLPHFSIGGQLMLNDLTTVVATPVATRPCLWSKSANFRWVWHNMKIQPHHWELEVLIPHTSTFKWGI